MPLRRTGQVELHRNLVAIAIKAPVAAAQALYLESAVETTEAQRRTPVWNPARKVPPGHAPGSLRASARTHLPTIRANRIQVDITFGNQLVDYAAAVHDDPEAFHATGEWNYLGGTLKESEPYMPARIARRLSETGLLAVNAAGGLGRYEVIDLGAF